MNIYLEETLERFLNDLASAKPTPGGGSSTALSGAMAAALASMVCRLTIDKEAYVDVRQEIEELLGKAENLRFRFQQLMQEDIAAYGRLSESFKLPRETIEERVTRSDTIQKQLFEAALVPLEVAERSAELLQSCQRIAEIGNTAVLSDVATGAMLASSGGEGAAFMVRVNLRSMKNDKIVEEFNDRLNTALTIILEGIKNVTNIVEDRA